MPVVIDGGRVPTRWSERVAWRKCSYAAPRTQCLHVALVNNMPDAALEDTEMQFFELLDAASGQMPLKVRLYSLPELARGERAQQHLSDFYFPFDDLLKSRLTQ